MKQEINHEKNVITPRELRRRLQQGETTEILDVRTGPEHDAAHLPEAEWIPLDELNADAFIRKRKTGSGPVFLLCQSGNRARKAAERFKQAGFNDCVVVEGGLQAWLDCGLPVQRGVSKVLPLMQQVQVVVGFLCFTGAVLALGVDRRFAIVPLVMGAGLLFAGLTGTCGLALLLAKMPWNRRCAHSGGTCAAKG